MASLQQNGSRNAHGEPSTASLPCATQAVIARTMVATPVACISSESLLAGGNEVCIEHNGAIYRLKQTALGKLILTK